MLHTNLRSFCGTTGFLYHSLGFGRFRLFCKWYGGHWEKWYQDVIHTDNWFAVQICIRLTDDSFENRPPLARGTPECESWPVQVL